MATTQQMMNALFATLNDGRPMHEIMRANEREAGFIVVLPGDVPWLSVADWHPTITVSRNGNDVRLVAILANNPGNGALRRTVQGIINAGLVPVVIEPTHEMRATMQRWKWKRRIVGHGFFDREEQWRPRKNWKPTAPRSVDRTDTQNGSLNHD